MIASPGISPAMTDALLLYGLKRPVYPADRPTYRILARHGWIYPTTDYEEARATIEEPAHGDVVVLSNLASWFDRVGELYCRARVAPDESIEDFRLTSRCPVEPDLLRCGHHDIKIRGRHAGCGADNELA